jgi:hypothetical protein
MKEEHELDRDEQKKIMWDPGSILFLSVHFRANAK